MASAGSVCSAERKASAACAYSNCSSRATPRLFWRYAASRVAAAFALPLPESTPRHADVSVTTSARATDAKGTKDTKGARDCTRRGDRLPSCIERSPRERRPLYDSAPLLHDDRLV